MSLKIFNKLLNIFNEGIQVINSIAITTSKLPILNVMRKPRRPDIVKKPPFDIIQRLGAATSSFCF
jgi:hypothetical protein